MTEEAVCYWCVHVQGKKRDDSLIKDKIYQRDLKKVNHDFAMFYSGLLNFHKECLILQIKHELELEEHSFNRTKEGLLKEIAEVELSR